MSQADNTLLPRAIDDYMERAGVKLTDDQYVCLSAYMASFQFDGDRFGYDQVVANIRARELLKDK